MIKNESGFGTLASIITKKKSLQDQNIVKVTTKKILDTSNFPEALNFMRKADEQNEKMTTFSFYPKCKKRIWRRAFCLRITIIK